MDKVKHVSAIFSVSLTLILMGCGIMGKTDLVLDTSTQEFSLTEVQLEFGAPLPESHFSPRPPLANMPATSNGFGNSWCCDTKGRAWYGHTGADYGAPEGTIINSIYYGKVVKTGWDNGWGNYIIVRHGYWYNRSSTYVIYAHLRVDFVSEGTWLTPGKQIAAVGNTGFSTKPHLHIGVMNSSSPGRAYIGKTFTGFSQFYDARTGITHFRPSNFW